MPVMRGIYSDGSLRAKPIKGWHSHIPANGFPLCKLDRRQSSSPLHFLKWIYEDSTNASCPACQKIAAAKGGAA